MDDTSLLPFQQDIVVDLAANSCLCLLASGLIWQHPLCALLRSHRETSSGVILLLSFQPQQKESLLEVLQKDQTGVQLHDVNNAVLASQRRKLYASGSCCFVTTRILVVDFLSGTLLPESVAGIFILNAHRVTDDSGEAFAVRLLRRSTKNGFILAFSDQPPAFSSGIRKAEEIMRALHVRRLSLWPRFQVVVKSNLEDVSIQVTEIAQPLTPAMASIQESIKELMSLLMTELRKTNTFDSSELTLENALFRSFDKILKRQLDLVWYTATWKTKQLIEDLKQLRELLSDLLTHDAVTFLSFLERIKATGGDSIWLFHNAAHDIFEQAKQRVYHLSLEDSKPQNKRRKAEQKAQPIPPKKPIIQPVLEQLPKWKALQEILKENHGPDSPSKEPQTVLIVCKEMFLKTQLELALKDPDQLMKQLFEEYLISRRQLDDSLKFRTQKRSYSTQKCDLSLYQRTDLMRLGPDLNPTEALALEEATDKRKTKRKKPKKPKESPDEEKEEEEVSGRPSLLYDKELWESETTHEILQNVYFHALDSKEELALWKFQPTCIILYHSDIGFIRQIEIYQAKNPHLQLKVYLLYYDQSIEKTKYEISVERESEIFGELIQHKGRIMVPTDLDTTLEPSEMTEDFSKTLGIEGSNALTRRGGIQSILKPHTKIVVDMREFMSKLPTLLHKSNFDLKQMTLEIGDYILAPGLVVERKSLADLSASLRSGRLYNQAEAMTKNFEFPVLLIEFEAVKQFRVQSDEELGKEISPQNIISKLVLLISHFPKLKLVWSQSPQATCEIFENFKRSRPDPETSTIQDFTPQEVMNQSAVEILKKLPGINESNYRKVMKSCRSLSALANESLESLSEILGSKKNAKTLFHFLQAPCPKW